MEQVLIQQFRIPAIDEEFSNGTKKVIVPDTRTDDIYLGMYISFYLNVTSAVVYSFADLIKVKENNRNKLILFGVLFSV